MADSNLKKEPSPHDNCQTIDINLVDNQVNNDAILVNSMPDNELLLPNNVPENETLLADSIEIQADLTADTESSPTDKLLKEPIPDKLSIKGLEERYKIKRAALYKRMEYLGITSCREGKNAYLNAEQIAHMDGLHEHMQNDKMDNYPIPQTIGAKEKEELTSQLQNFTPEKLEISDGAITLQQSGITEANINHNSASNYEPELEVIEPSISEAQLGEIDTEAQYLAATRLIVPEELADYYESTGNFTIPEIIQSIEQRREKTAQRWKAKHAALHPKHVTQLLMERVKTRQVVGVQEQKQVVTGG
jgi:hypothetical protein